MGPRFEIWIGVVKEEGLDLIEPVLASADWDKEKCRVKMVMWLRVKEENYPGAYKFLGLQLYELHEKGE